MTWELAFAAVGIIVSGGIAFALCLLISIHRINGEGEE